MSRFGLVIQGPLVSHGRKSGQNAHVPWRRIPGEQAVRYDCRENIRAIIRDYGKLFECIVISTWQDEVLPGDFWEGATLIASDDKTLPTRYRSSEKGHEVLDNRFRQMFGVLVGIEYLEAHSNADMAVKIRTDQYLDLEAMLEFITRSQTLRRYTNDVIFVPSIMREDARYGILDFYFAGNLSAMKRFHRSFLEYGAFDFDPSIHRDLWLKYAHRAYSEAIGTPKYAYFPASSATSYCEETLQVFSHMVSRVFWPLSFECFQKIVWRGSPWSKEALEFERRNNLFQENVSEEGMRASLSAGCPRFLGINWKRYANFRLHVLKKPFSAKEKVFVYGNMLLQSIFRFLDRSGYFFAHPAAFFSGGKRRLTTLLESRRPKEGS